MLSVFTMGLLLAATPPPEKGSASPDLQRAMIADTALRQLEQPDPAWQPAQRDCAGLVRFAYQHAFRRLDPGRMAAGPWHDAAGRPLAFADAGNLLQHDFRLLGRDARALEQAESGDLLAFQQQHGQDEEPVFHLMLVVRGAGVRAGPVLLVYHTGDARGVQAGGLRELREQAPHEWRPDVDNTAFLGIFRLREWMP
ncbi:MAG: DUF1175 family protein [Pseudomonadota bacterium]